MFTELMASGGGGGVGSQLKALVPQISSASSAVTQSGYYAASYMGWCVFDRTYSTKWQTAGNAAVNSWVAYEFPTAQKVNAVYIENPHDAGNVYAPCTFRIEGYDGSNWKDLTGVLTHPSNDMAYGQIYTFDNSNSYIKYRIYVLSSYGGSGTSVANVYCGINDMQFYEAI